MVPGPAPLLETQVDVEYNNTFIALARRGGARAFLLLGAMRSNALACLPLMRVKQTAEEDATKVHTFIPLEGTFTLGYRSGAF
jgi:hypothetical protein